MRFLKFGSSIAATAMAVAFSLPASALEDFTIDESSLEGSGGTINADQLNGNYNEAFLVTGVNTFSTIAVFNAGAWFDDGAAVFGQQLNTTYKLYGLFTASGTFAPNGSGGFDFSGGAGTIELWADLDGNSDWTSLDATAADLNFKPESGAVGTQFDDDVMLGFASNLDQGEGSLTGGLANGNFELIFDDWTLTNPEGEAYFIVPDDFYMVVDINGNFQAIDPANQLLSFIEQSSANVFFNRVPVPSSLALFGIALAGMGMFGRRK